MAYLDTAAPTPLRVSPQLLMGVGSPLWGYFAAANAGGLAFWWMTRWTRPVSLEALFDGFWKPAMPPLALAPAAAPMIETVAATVEPVADAPEPEAILGGEAAPVAPPGLPAIQAEDATAETAIALLAADATIEVEAETSSIAAAASPPDLESAPESAAVAAPEEAASTPKLKSKKAPSPPASDSEA